VDPTGTWQWVLPGQNDHPREFYCQFFYVWPVGTGPTDNSEGPEPTQLTVGP